MIARTTSARALLSCDALWLRFGWFASVFGGIVILRSFAPSQLSAWTVPYFMRSDHRPSLFVLWDDARDASFAQREFFCRASIHNWLAFPILGVALLLSALFLAELIVGKKLRAIRRPIRVSPQMLAFGFAIMLSPLWSLQVYLAVSQHKSELAQSFRSALHFLW